MNANIDISVASAKVAASAIPAIGARDGACTRPAIRRPGPDGKERQDKNDSDGLMVRAPRFK